jgi:tetratricopeptide (TPR) repeat protein
LKTSVNLLPPEDKIKNLYFLGTEEYGKNNLKAADMYFNEVIKNGYAEEKNNKNILYGTYYYLGLISYSDKNYRLSLEYFKKGYDIDPSGMHFQYELSQIAYIYMKYLKNKGLALKYYNLLEKNASSAVYKSLASSMISAIGMQK